MVLLYRSERPKLQNHLLIAVRIIVVFRNNKIAGETGTGACNTSPYHILFSSFFLAL